MGDVVALRLFQTAEYRVLESAVALCELDAKNLDADSRASAAREVLIELGMDLARKGARLPVPINLAVLDFLYFALPHHPRQDREHRRLIKAIVAECGDPLFH